jgi:hypothetical protein
MSLYVHIVHILYWRRWHFHVWLLLCPSGMFGEQHDQHDQHVSQVWSTSCTVCQTQSQDTVILVESPWWLLGSNLSNLHKTRPMKISKSHCELLKRYLILSHGISLYIIYQCFLHFITDCSLQTCLHHNGRAWDFPRLSWYQTMTQWWSASIAKKMGVLAASSTGFTGSTLPKAQVLWSVAGWRPRSVPLYEKTWVGEMMNWGSKLPIYNQTKLVQLVQLVRP